MIQLIIIQSYSINKSLPIIKTKMIKANKILKKSLEFTRWTLDTTQKYTSWFMIGNTLMGGKNFDAAIATMARTAFAKLNEGDRLGDAGKYIDRLHWYKFLEHKGNFSDVFEKGNAVYSQFFNVVQPGANDVVEDGDFELVQDKVDKVEPFDLFKSVWLTGVGGLIELNTTGTHLSLSVPAALLISGDVTSETIAMPLMTMIAIDSVLNMGEVVFVDSHPELSY
jgi:hypothetical protein